MYPRCVRGSDEELVLKDSIILTARTSQNGSQARLIFIDGSIVFLPL